MFVKSWAEKLDGFDTWAHHMFEVELSFTFTLASHTGEFFQNYDDFPCVFDSIEMLGCPLEVYSLDPIELLLLTLEDVCPAPCA